MAREIALGVALWKIAARAGATSADAALQALAAPSSHAMSDSDDDETYTAEEAATFSLGFNVCVCGLLSKPELNGKCGRTTAYNREKGRFAVAIEGGPSMLLKPAHLTSREQYDGVVAASLTTSVFVPGASS